MDLSSSSEPIRVCLENIVTNPSYGYTGQVSAALGLCLGYAVKTYYEKCPPDLKHLIPELRPMALSFGKAACATLIVGGGIGMVTGSIAILLPGCFFFNTSLAVCLGPGHRVVNLLPAALVLFAIVLRMMSG